jgi:hypothetical protein
MRLARILVATAAAFWMTATLVADQHGHAPVPHATQAHAANPGSTHPSTPGGTHHDGDRHSGTHTPPPSPIATKIQSHPQLAAKVTAMLPPGMTMNHAARGFKNQGQFIAALHASQRTGIPFTDLKRAMVRQHESLGQAVHSLSPSATGGTTTGTTPTTTRTHGQ